MGNVSGNTTVVRREQRSVSRLYLEALSHPEPCDLYLNRLILSDHPQLFRVRAVWHHLVSADSHPSPSSSPSSLLAESPPLTQTSGAGSASYTSHCSLVGWRHCSGTDGP